MKRLVIAAAAALLCAAGVGAQTRVSKKILVAYFSWSGNAKVLAEQAARETGGDLFEIKTIKTYPVVYDECSRMAREEQIFNARPALAGKASGMDRYDTVILCSPNWWRTLPMAVFTFLESHDLSGKTIYPLITHGRDAFGTILEDLRKTCPGAVIGEGIAVEFYDKDPADNVTTAAPNRDVSAWLRRNINIEKTR